MRKVQWAVVGTSTFALDWIACGIKLASNAELAAIVSRDAARVGAPRHYASIDAIDVSIEHLSKCVVSGGAPVISGERGRANIAVIEAALLAAKTKTIVELSPG
jgi:predicted dehydrogenase